MRHKVVTSEALLALELCIQDCRKIWACMLFMRFVDFQKSHRNIATTTQAKEVKRGCCHLVKAVGCSKSLIARIRSKGVSGLVWAKKAVLGSFGSVWSRLEPSMSDA